MYNAHNRTQYPAQQPQDPTQWFANALINDINRDVNKDLLHNVFWQRFSQNNYSNQDFTNLVNNTADMAAYLIACNGNQPNQMIMDDAVAKTITVTAILMLEQNPYWEKDLPPQALQALRQQAGPLKNLLNQVIQFTEQSAQPQWQDPRNLRGGAAPQYNSAPQYNAAPAYQGGSVGGGVQLGAGNGPSRYHAEAPMHHAPAAPRYQPTGPRGVAPQVQPQQPQGSGPRRAFSVGAPVNAPRSGGVIENVSSPGVAAARQQASEERSKRRYSTLYDPSAHVEHQPQASYAEPQIPDDDDRHWFKETVTEPAQQQPENEFQLVDPAEWPLIWSSAKRNPEQPYSITYNPRTQVKFYRRLPDGSLEQKIETNMNYKDHEPNPELRQQAEQNERNKDEVVVPVAALLAGESIDIGAVKIDESGDKPKPVAETPKVITNKNVIVATSETEARVFVNAELRGRNIHTVPNDTSIEFYYQQNNVLGVYDDPLYEDVVAMVKEFSQDHTGNDLSELASLLTQRAGSMPMTLWHRINDHATAVVNSLVTNELGYGGDLTMDSFSDDFDALMDRLLEDLGPVVIERVAKLAPEIRSIVANILTGENLETARKFQKAQYRSNNRQKELEWVIDHSIISAELVSITRVPQTAKRLDLVLDTPVVVIKESTTPTLFAAIQGIFERASKINRTFTHHYLDTADGVRIELHRALLGNNTCFVASKV